MNFHDFKLHPSLFEGIEDMGFETPTPIQEQVIPLVMSGKDVIACAQTGTGKTAAFMVPLIQKIVESAKSHGMFALIIVPTRELAMQIDGQARGFAYHTSISIASVYGGGESSDWDRQKKALKMGADIIIATPGRLLSHLGMGYVDASSLKYLVLDEADKMLDMGFYEDIMAIENHLPENKNVLMFSATMPSGIRKMANNIMNDASEVNIQVSTAAEGIVEGAYMVFDRQKNPLIGQLLEGRQLTSVLVFTATKKKAGELSRELRAKKINARAIHSDLSQSEREEVMLNFRNKKVTMLVATDVLSRGIDVLGIELVINYDVPHDPEDYIHRIGRTARADASGVAITLVNEKDNHYFRKIEKFLGRGIRKLNLPEGMGDGPVFSERRSGGKSRTPSYHKKNYRNKRSRHRDDN